MPEVWKCSRPRAPCLFCCSPAPLTQQAHHCQLLQQKPKVGFLLLLQRSVCGEKLLQRRTCVRPLLRAPYEVLQPVAVCTSRAGEQGMGAKAGRWLGHPGRQRATE